MKSIILLTFMGIVFLTSCQSEPKFLSTEQIDKEKKAVVETIKNYNRSAERKNFAEMVETLAGEVRFFGTDSGEVINSFGEYKATMMQQWKEYDMLKYGELSDVYIEMDPNANVASMIYGVPLHVKKGTIEEDLYLKVARTLKKENNKWVIVSGLMSIPRTVVKAADHAPEAPVEEKK